jgi:uncharacterized Zn finger protein
MPARRRPSRARSRSYDDDGYDGFPRSRPIRTDQGLKAKSQRGDFGSSWWSQRWIAALERFGWGNRLTRGRSYARQGQVLRIDVGVGRVAASVQGSRPTPYTVTIQVAPLQDGQWEQVADTLAQQALFAAKLLAGEMPQNIEEAFTHAGVPLFPQSSRDLVTQCSCPDFANPCKHIAAVYYLLGERFDEDPFLLFHLRGRTQEQVMAMLRRRRVAPLDETDEAAPALIPVEPVAALEEVLDQFYQTGAGIETMMVELAPPAVDAPVLRQLGPPPACTERALREVYAAMTAAVRERVFGEGE